MTPIKFSDLFGYHNEKTLNFSATPDEREQFCSYMLKWNILGYIPLVSLVVGIIRIIAAIQLTQKRGVSGATVGLGVRGAMEALQLFPLLMAIDAIVTFGRWYSMVDNQAKTPV